jgi:hypothetical protein
LYRYTKDNESALGDKKGKTTPALTDFLQPVIDDMDPEAGARGGGNADSCYIIQLTRTP